MTRTERCACGGCITAPADDWAAIAAAVRLHNSGPQHQAWRLGLQLITERYLRDGLGVWRAA